MKLPTFSLTRQRENSKDKFSFKQIPKAFLSMPRVLRFVWSTNIPLTILLAVVTILQGCLPAISISITALLIDSVVKGISIHSVTPIWLPVGLQLGALLLSNVLNTLNDVVQKLLQEQVMNRIQFLILEKANTLDLAYFENPEFYDHLRQSTSQSNNQVLSMINQTFKLCSNILSLLSMLFILIQLSWWMTIIAIVVAIPAFIFDTRYGWDGYQLILHQSPSRRLMLYFQTLMATDTYNKEIKLFNLGNYFIGQFRGLAQKFYKENKSILIRRSLTESTWNGLSDIAHTAIYIYVALQTIAGKVSLGGLSLYTQAVTQVGHDFQTVLNNISSTYESNLYIGTIFEILENYKPNIVSPQNPRPLNPNNESKGFNIEFRDVSFSYPGKDATEESALKHVSFTIQAGETIALVGRNGAGKTTLIKLLTRLYDPDEGEILINDYNIKEYDLHKLREIIGVIFQDYVNYYMSAHNNIGVGLIDKIGDRALVERAAHDSSADRVIEKLPQGYDTMLGRWFNKGTQLSGGEWQKIALARAFMRDANILVLDEPTSSLDAQAEYEVFQNFRTLSSNKTAIFISHRFSTVRLSDRIFVVENGTIVESGSHQELIKLSGRYAELFNLQAEAYR